MAMSSGVSIQTEKSMKAPLARCARPNEVSNQNERPVFCVRPNLCQSRQRADQLGERELIRVAVAPNPVLNLLFGHAGMESVVGDRFGLRVIAQQKPQ
ncbi:MAG TPA: hypothetical protein VMV19_09640 [Xanthobacteraceae bacterium]|nr:hypothetical protein [Xanthobacteraceae bacterium]